MDLQQNAIYGTDVRAYNYLGATMANPQTATGETDWGAILANGIRGAAQGAIQARVEEAYASGQLYAPAPAYEPRGPGMTGLLLLAGLAWIVMGAD